MELFLNKELFSFVHLFVSPNELSVNDDEYLKHMYMSYEANLNVEHLVNSYCVNCCSFAKKCTSWICTLSACQIVTKLFVFFHSMNITVIYFYTMRFKLLNDVSCLLVKHMNVHMSIAYVNLHEQMFVPFIKCLINTNQFHMWLDTFFSLLMQKKSHLHP